MNTFFTQTHCDRCGGSLKGGRIMSIYSTECLCLICKDQEKKRADYADAVKAEHEEIKKGNYNFKGIKG